MLEKFYLTTPIYYVNARPHIGHAYTTLAADVIARRHRLLGHDTFFLTGTDEHGQKIERSAAAAGVPPQQFADDVSATFEALWRRMGITHDKFIRTTSAEHQRGVQKLFQVLLDKGAIYLSSYTGQYCVSDEAFVDVAPGAPCPDCGRPTETLTEENYFFRLSQYQRQLIDLIESGTLAIQPEVRKNEVLSFLRGNVPIAGRELGLPRPVHEPVILSEVEGPAVPPSLPRIPTVAHSRGGTPYVEGALKDLSISRTSFTWGVPVPNNEKHVIYVWLDALANYMTALGYGSDSPEDIANFNKYWPADLHLVGKEIIRFHCVYWPAFLLAAELPLPKAITAHGWLLFEDSKMSKSRGNVVRAETILDAFGTEVYAKQFLESTKAQQDLFATDVLRYFLLREIPFGQDGSFSFDALITRYNADLANGYGNLVSRTLSLTVQNYSAIPPAPGDGKVYTDGSLEPPNNLYEASADHFYSKQEIVAYLNLLEKSLETSFANTQLENYLSVVQQSVGVLDRFISFHKPWMLAKVGDDLSLKKLAEVLYTAAESIRIITALLYPILPYATAQVWSQLGLGDIEQAAKNGELTNLQWGGLKPGTKLGPLSPIFPRADKGLAQIMTDMEAANAPKPASTESVSSVSSLTPELDSNNPAAGPRTTAFTEPSPGTTVAGSHALTTERVLTPHTEATPSGIFAAESSTPQIAVDDFLKVDLRVAKILVAERIPKADKLLRLEVDLGPDFAKRQILSGIAEWYTPEELIGRRIVIVANLAPRKMRGLESHGMLLAASDGENGKPILTTFGEEIALGSRIR